MRAGFRKNTLSSCNFTAARIRGAAQYQNALHSVGLLWEAKNPR